MSTWMGNTGMQSWTGTRGKNYTIDGDNRVSTWWHWSLSMKLSSRNLRSCGEAMNVMLWGLMSSKVELSMRVMGEVWQVSELAEISQQCHVSVTGHNTLTHPVSHPVLALHVCLTLCSLLHSQFLCQMLCSLTPYIRVLIMYVFDMLESQLV